MSWSSCSPASTRSIYRSIKNRGAESLLPRRLPASLSGSLGHTIQSSVLQELIPNGR